MSAVAEESLRGRIESELRFMNGQLVALRDTADEVSRRLLWERGPDLSGIRNALDAIGIALQKPPSRLQRFRLWFFRRRTMIRLAMLWFRFFPRPIVLTPREQWMKATRDALAEFENGAGRATSKWGSLWD